ncbi:hypothetical protein C0992_005792, partial [Termitomyces sp. T32_za158]
MDMIQGFRNIIDSLLVFVSRHICPQSSFSITIQAALFSAVVTTFVAQTSQALQPDNSQIMVSLLIETNQLLRAAGNKTSINAVPTASLGPESLLKNTTINLIGVIMTSPVMGPDSSESTSETLQFAKFNGTNYHIWSDNMKAALQAKTLWGLVSGREHHPPVPPTEYPGLMRTPCPTEGDTSVQVRKEGQELMDVLQSKEYSIWEQANDRYER